jgi:hypothetical protein
MLRNAMTEVVSIKKSTVLVKPFAVVEEVVNDKDTRSI